MKTGKNRYYRKTLWKTVFVAGMAITIPAASFISCGKGEDITEKDTVAPTIDISKSEIDIKGGKEIKISGNQLYIGDNLVASWSDNKSTNCNVELSLNGKSITSGTTISEAGTLNIKVSDAAGNTKTADIKLSIESDISGLDNLKNLNMQVDQEINLLNGVTFGNGAELIKTEIEIDGQRTEIVNPTHYTPEYPGTCSIILTVKGKDGKVTEYKVDNLTIKPLEYNEVTINEANMINEKYPWYNNLQQSTKDFIYPHLMASYAACNWSKLDNRVHIIMGEAPYTDDVENIGTADVKNDSHAYEGYYRIRATSPDVIIKGCRGGRRAQLENYINQHPDKVFLVSCAADTGGGGTREELNRNNDTQPTRNILEKENVIVIAANGNRIESSGLWKVFCENIRDGNRYKSASINSKLNNKITVVGYNSRGDDNYFAPINHGGLESAMPVGYEKDKGNIVMPIIPLIWSNNKEDKDTSSSFPTAVTSGVVGNAISIIMASHPGITAEDAMTIICDNYLREETFQYKDNTTNWKLVDGGKWNFIEIQKLLDHELLQADQLNSLHFNADEVELPFSQGLCYTGIGVQFEYEGQKYDCVEANLSTLKEALKSGAIKWYWNKSRFRKYGGTDSATLKAYIIDCNYNSIPDLQLKVTKKIQ